MSWLWNMINPNAQAMQPNNEPECMTHFNAAIRQLQNNQTEEAYEGLLYSVKIDDEYKIEQRVSTLMKVMEQMQKFEEMVDLTDKLLEKKPNSLTFLVWKGVAHKNLDNMDECEICFEKACNLQPTNEMFVNLYCSVLMKKEKWSKFVEVNKRMIDGKPTAATYHNNYVQGLENLGLQKEADEHIEQILEKYGATQAAINFICGDYYYKHELFDKAEKCQKKAAELDISNEKFQEYYIRSLLQNGKENEAAKYCQELIDKNSSNIKWINTVGYICFDAFDFESAAKHFQKCMEMAPNDPYYVVDLAMVLCELNRLDEAEKLIKNTLTKYPNLTHVQYRYARILEYKKEYKKSQEIYLNILSLKPNQGKINMGYAHLLYLMNEYQASMKYFQIALKVDKMNPWTHYWYALLLCTDEYKKYDEAINEFEHCLKLQINHHKCHYQYGCLLYNVLNKNKKKAINHIKQATKIDFKNEEYKKTLQQFEKNYDPSNDDDDDDDNNDDEKEEKKDDGDDNIAKLVKKEYIFKSMDNKNNSVICMDNDYKDLVFKLNKLNVDEIKKLNDVIKQGSNEKKDVKIVVVETHTKNNKITQKVSHAQL